MKRWQKAQNSERAFWESSFKDEEAFRKMCLGFYPIYKEFLDKNEIDTTDKIILDCGSGSYGFVSVIDGKSKYALDPLMDYFKTKVPQDFYKEKNIIPIQGTGEDLSFEKDFFDLICCINTLDHADNPGMVMQEANRCLKTGGYLLLSCNHYARPIVMYRRFLELIGAGDLCHPNTYHLDDIKRLIYLNGFKIIDQKIGDTKEMSQKIAEAGGQTNVTVKERATRAIKSKGWWHIFKQMLAAPLHFIFNKLFKTYPDSIFLCQEEYDLK